MRDGTDPLRWDPAATLLITLARNAHHGIHLLDVDRRDADHWDDVDYWYRLGQRNAFAHAAVLLIARGVDSAASAVSEPVTDALSDGVSDPPALRDAGASQTWLGLLQFHRQLLGVPGVDGGCGMRWGSNRDQRLTSPHRRRRGRSRDRGLRPDRRRVRVGS